MIIMSIVLYKLENARKEHSAKLIANKMMMFILIQ